MFSNVGRVRTMYTRDYGCIFLLSESRVDKFLFCKSRDRYRGETWLGKRSPDLAAPSTQLGERALFCRQTSNRLSHLDRDIHFFDVAYRISLCTVFTTNRA